MQQVMPQVQQQQASAVAAAAAVMAQSTLPAEKQSRRCGAKKLDPTLWRAPRRFETALEAEAERVKQSQQQAPPSMPLLS